MNFLKAALAATAMTAFAASAQAQDSDTYINLGVQNIESDFFNVVARIGYNFGENFGVEAEGSLGVSGDSETFSGIDYEAKVSNSFSGYLVGRYPIAEQFEVFARAGYHTSKVKETAEGASIDESASFSQDGIAFGGGLQYNFDGQNGIRLGYTNLDGDGGSADVYDISYVRKF